MDYISSFSSTDNFTYLGVHIVPDVGKIVQTNYNPTLESIYKSIERWSNMPISLIGRINILKMNILPKLLYLFQNIPLPLPISYFSKLRKACLNFIWNNRRHRLHLTLLYLPYDRGGLKLPNFQWYYWAAQLRTIMYYFSSESAPAWVDIESLSLTPKLTLNTYMFSASIKKLREQTTNPFVLNMINVWYNVRDLLGENSLISHFSPIWGNDQFKPGKADQGFCLWA